MERSKVSLCLEVTQLCLIFAVVDSGDGTLAQPAAAYFSLNAHWIYTLGEKDPKPGITAE